jgi:hypothetical protein
MIVLYVYPPSSKGRALESRGEWNIAKLCVDITVEQTETGVIGEFCDTTCDTVANNRDQSFVRLIHHYYRNADEPGPHPADDHGDA